MTDLSTLGGRSSRANAINNAGTVVGIADLAAADQRHAFIWEHGQMQDLNNVIRDGSGWVLENATDINKRGQIVGTGVHNGQFSGFLLTPCDEQETGARCCHNRRRTSRTNDNAARGSLVTTVVHAHLRPTQHRASCRQPF
jgi:probable HAF family extracellular repeat protein